ncbi:MAG: prepilin-type N-terminal cleavage/methylation domain-containing protein [Candidatus Firestonebacteria bacterium]
MLILRIGRRSRKKGFTLIELLVVISIIISIISVFSVWLGNFLASRELYSEVTKISSISYLAKELAETSGFNHRIYINVSEGKYRIAMFKGGDIYEQPVQVKAYSLKPNIFIKSFNTTRGSISAESSESAGLTEDYITFYPDGSSEQGKLVLQNQKGELYTIYYASTTGMVKVYPYEML